MQLTKMVNKVSNPVSKDTVEFIEYIYDITNDEGQPCGRLRFEIMDNLLFATPIPFNAKPSDIKILKAKLYELGAEVMDKFHYSVAFVYTKNKKMISLFSTPALKYASTTDEGHHVYYIEREDI